jgi:hypothetical protein
MVHVDMVYRKTAATSKTASHDGFKQIEQRTIAGFEQLNADVLKIRDHVSVIPCR